MRSIISLLSAFLIGILVAVYCLTAPEINLTGDVYVPDNSQVVEAFCLDLDPVKYELEVMKYSLISSNLPLVKGGYLVSSLLMVDAHIASQGLEQSTYARPPPDSFSQTAASSRIRDGTDQFKEISI